MKNELWIKNKGYFSEYKDALGNQIVHDKPGIWSIYHVSDAFILDEFEDYQNLQYINNHTPKIPITVKGADNKDYFTLATTNWQPYDWSINNVALAENLQTALAYWQAGRNEDAYQLWKGNLVESMYYGISPGNFEQLSHYDAFRGELYRDFADPIGVASRTLTEGLFGVYPNLLENKISIKPGFPKGWNSAELKLPDWEYQFTRTSKKTEYLFNSKYQNPVSLEMQIPVNYSNIKSVKVNGKNVDWKIKPNSILQPIIQFEAPKGKDFKIEINYSGEEIKNEQTDYINYISENLQLNFDSKKKIKDVFDPQELIKTRNGNQFSLIQQERKGTFFVQVEQNGTTWWQPVNVDIRFPLETKWTNKKLQIQAKSANAINGKLVVNGLNKTFSIQKNQNISIEIPSNYLSKGTNSIDLEYNGIKQNIEITDWEIENEGLFNNISLASKYNEKVTEIFNQKYLSPRLEFPTLQLPWQGIGNWCYPLITAQIDDSGLMNKRKNGKVDFLGIPFLINKTDRNIAFASQWDNYPESIEIPVSGKGKKIYFLMAGSTNPMQSQIVNGTITVQYIDGSTSELELKNPTNWWPIEQDLFDDNFAFEIPDDKIPYRVKLKTGELYKGGTLSKYSSIKGFTDRQVDGGAATILDLPIDPNKELKSIKLTAVSNDVVIGMMSATVLK
ncbi:MAG: glycogen debranching protein, partial [Chryseobacterium sp.]